MGEDILVAPVLEEGKVSRNVYLPRGVWTDQYNGESYTGPIWLNDYPANLSVLPYFIRSGAAILTFKFSSILIALFTIILFASKS